jgi:hypothetical protein
LAEAAAIHRIRSCWLEQQLLAGAADTVAVEAVSASAPAVDAAAATTATVCQKTKEAVVERMAGARALILPGEEGCEVSDGLWSPDPAISELEFNFVSEEREELEEGEYEKSGAPLARAI